MRRTYRYRLYPTRRQGDALTAQLADACALYNAALEQRRRLWREHGVSVSYGEQSAELRELRAAGLLNDGANFWSQQAVLRRLDCAFAAFFRRVKAGEKPGYPRFKSRRRFDTLDWSFAGNAGGVALTDGGRLRLQGVGHVKIKLHRPIPDGARLCEARVSRRNGRWYVAISLDLATPEPLPATGRSVGLDVGITTFVATSDGELISGPRANRAMAKAVRRAQRKVARRARGLARGMLAKDCNDQGWAAFVARLAEKAEEAARQVIPVDARYTSQACSACGEIVPKALGVRVHECACGYTADRDVNAARNVLARGLGCSLQAQTVGAEVRAVA